jgi:hypothetical protein
MRLLFALLLVAVSTLTSAETYLQINGASIHDKPGFNGVNYGLGVEQTVTTDWNIAAGWYKNSEYNGSAYAYGRYSFYRIGHWDIGAGFGMVTGYRRTSVTPMAFPEICYGYLCGIFLPQVNTTGANAVGVHLKLPITYLLQ